MSSAHTSLSPRHTAAGITLIRARGGNGASMKDLKGIGFAQMHLGSVKCWHERCPL